MKKLLIILIGIFFTSSLFAEDAKLRVAVFDPTSSGTSIDSGTKIAIREIISSTIVNTRIYDIVERSLLEKVMQEQQFSNSGAVDDMQATEIGKLAGANKIVLSVVTLTGGRNMLSIKIIDVKTASVDRQKVKVVTSGELLDAIEPLTLEMLDLAPAQGIVSAPYVPATNNNVEDSQTSGKQSKVGAAFSSIFTRKDSQDSSKSNAQPLVPQSAPDSGIVFYGIDYSAVKICGATESNEQFAKAFVDINELMVKEWGKFNIGKLINKDVAVYTIPAAERSNYIDWTNIRTLNTNPQKLPLEKMIGAYNIPVKSGVGIVLIAWVLNKNKGLALYEVVVFDTATRQIIFNTEASAEVGGSGLRNYWGNTVYNLTKNKKLGKLMSSAF